MRKVKLGVIGCGAMGARHVAAAQASECLEVVAVADAMPARAREIAETHRVAKVYDDGGRLLEDKTVEAVILALPTAIRSSLAAEAFRRGKHVLLEKPAAMSVGDLERIVAVQGNLTGACCSSRYRSLPSARAATEFLQTGRLGPIRSLIIREFQQAGPRPQKERPAWRLSRSLNGGGILVNWGVYDLDYMLGLTGWNFQPVWALARAWPVAPVLSGHVHPDSDAETHISGLVSGADGSVLQIERAESAALRSENAWQIVGTNGSLRLQLRAGSGKTIFHDFLDAEKGLLSEILWEGDENGSGLTPAPLLDFAQAILEGRAPLTTLEQSLHVQRIVDALYASSDQGKPVSL